MSNNEKQICTKQSTLTSQALIQLHRPYWHLKNKTWYA